MENYTWEVEGTLPVKTNQNSVNKPGTFHEYRRPVWFIAEAPTLEEALRSQGSIDER
jgi:hypothetical protein